MRLSAVPIGIGMGVCGELATVNFGEFHFFFPRTPVNKPLSRYFARGSSSPIHRAFIGLCLTNIDARLQRKARMGGKK
jgi:hypothetical protein